jgi:hypothetical protein
LQDPALQVSPEFVQADTEAEHLHWLFVASQYAPVAVPTQLVAVPHLHTPDWQVSPELEQASTFSAHLHWLFSESQYVPVPSPSHVSRLPHLHRPKEQVSPELLHTTPAQRSIIVAEEALTNPEELSLSVRSPKKSSLYPINKPKHSTIVIMMNMTNDMYGSAAV